VAGRVQQHLDGTYDGGGDDEIDLDEEASRLDPAIYPAATRKGGTLSRHRRETSLMPPRTVFLTGATGYLGAHILADVLASTTADVVCVVRADGDAAAMERVKSTLEQYDLLDGVGGAKGLETDRRVAAVAGDLSKPLLGINPDSFKEVAASIDSIIHCGADVNLVKPYSALFASNVLGTQEALRLAATNSLFTTKVKPVHYISTNGVFPVNRNAYAGGGDGGGSGDGVVVCKENHAAVQAMASDHLKEGYARSKYVAETMCNIAAERGLPVSVMRPGNMAGNSTTGLQNTNDFVYLFLNGCLELGLAPDCDYAFDLTPVDFAAKVVVNAAVTNPSTVMGRTIHLQNPAPPVTLGFVADTLRGSGHTLATVDRQAFLDALHARCDEQRASGTQTSVLLQLESGFDAFEDYFYASTWLTYGTASMGETLAGTGIECPAVSKQLLDKWFPVQR